MWCFWNWKAISYFQSENHWVKEEEHWTCLVAINKNSAKYYPHKFVMGLLLADVFGLTSFRLLTAKRKNFYLASFYLQMETYRRKFQAILE